MRSHLGSLELHRGPFSPIWAVRSGSRGVHRLRTSRVPAGPGQESLAEKANFPALDQTRGEKYLQARKCRTNKYIQKSDLMPGQAPRQGRDLQRGVAALRMLNWLHINEEHSLGRFCLKGVLFAMALERAGLGRSRQVVTESSFLLKLGK